MSGHGLRLRNTGKELTISTDAIGLVCIGKMQPYGAVVQPSGVATSDDPGRMGGYSKYRITSSTPVIVAIDLPLNMNVGVFSVVQVSAGIWEATCYCGANPDVNGIDTTQRAIDVWAFAAAGKTGARGVLLRSPSGTIAYDLSHPYPLFPRGSGTNKGPEQAIAAVSRPVVLGAPADDPSEHGLLGGTANVWKFTRRRGVWTRTGAATLKSGVVTIQQYQYFSTDPRGDSNGDIYASTPYFILEGAQLP